MASTYSNLKIQLMTTGENSGTWGNVTNINLGTALEEAIVGSADVAFSSGTVTLTLTDSNATQTARNLRLNLTGTSGGAQNLIVPAIEKVYIVNNGCADAITVKNSTGTGIAVPAGKTMWVYNNGTNVVDVVTHLSSLTLGTVLPVASGGTGSNSGINASVNVFGILPVANGGTGVNASTGTGSVVLSASPTLSGVPAAPTASNGTNTTQIATTAFVTNSVTIATASLGTMSTQNANSVTITGGSITGITDLAVADGGTGASTFTANSIVLGNGASSLAGNMVAPGTSGNVLVSNGTTWASGAGFTWNVANVGTDTNNYSIPANAVLVMGTCYHYMGSNAGSAMSVNIKNSSGTTLYTYVLTGGNEQNGGDGGSGMSTRSAWSVAIPAAAQGGTLEFFRSSGGNGFTNTVNQVVTSA